MVGRCKPAWQKSNQGLSHVVMWHEVNEAVDVSFEDATKEHRRDAERSGEEIERLTVDENLGDIERACLFLASNAHPLQHSCAIGKLPSLFNEYGTKAHEAIFPTLTASLDEYSEHCQIQAAEALTTILLDASLSKEMLTEDLLQLALARAQGEESKQAHVVASSIFGAIAPFLDGKLILQTYLHKAMGLCQDTDSEVRTCMCEQLNNISRSVGLNTFMIFVFPELNELLRDEELVVQSAAVESLVQLLGFLPPDIRQIQVLPFLRSLCDEGNAAMHVCLARLLGDIIIKMVPDLLEDEATLLLDAYKILSQQANEDVRQLCAYNFPAILKTIGARKYSTMLHATYLQYIQDTSPIVRCTAAACLHEVAKILGKERTASYLRESFYSLLKDPALLVQSKLFGILHVVLGHFSVSNTQSKATTYANMIPSLLQAEKSVSGTNQWRMQRSLLQAFPLLAEYLTSDQIYENFVPICFRYMADGVPPVKISAALALAVFLRNNCKIQQRYELAQKVVKEYGQGQSYWSRLLYIDFCESFLRVASSRMFKESFLELAINALQDPVPSIRMRACQIINPLRTVIRLPDDVALLERINHLATQRLNDTDREVVEAARIASDSQKRVFVLDRDPSHDHPSAQDEYEKMDKLREDEEWNMLSKEEQEEKRKMDDNLQRAKIESLRKSSADATGRSGSTTSASDSSSSNASKKGSTSKTNAPRQGTDSGKSSRSATLSRTKSQLGTSGFTPPASSGSAPTTNVPSSGSNSLSTKRGSLPLSQKSLSPNSPPSRKPPSVASSPNPFADGTLPSNSQVPRRNSAKR
nr:serine/threonine-protein phosphatase 4 regulatory subunit 4-like isoform X3 [Physcomitrium patens]|eukprot:XP_024388060.1 serine/threonine-protein phosphatase 4 regulatory subunit 4-like isoform X3 [Physcomitrella patens]